MDRDVAKTEEEWRQELSPEQYHVLREQGTEPPFSHEYAFTKDRGVFRCAACGAELFSSDAKFDSGTGWPSFTEPRLADAVELRSDHSHGMVRTEVVCRRCGSHLGHVFDDGPEPGGLRYCINGVCLTYVSAAAKKGSMKSTANDTSSSRSVKGWIEYVPLTRLVHELRLQALRRRGGVEYGARGGSLQRQRRQARGAPSPRPGPARGIIPQRSCWLGDCASGRVPEPSSARASRRIGKRA